MVDKRRNCWTPHHCQILLASTRGERAIAMAKPLGCDDQTERLVIHGFNAAGLAVLQEGS